MASPNTMQIPGFIRQHYPLRSLNSIKTGGQALFYAPVATLAQLQATIHFCQTRQLPCYVLGYGSNVLISDEDFNGVVMKLDHDFQSISFDYAGQTVTAGAGAALIRLGHELAMQGYLGCAYMGVIPGTVGGSVRMNAGTSNDAEIKNNFLKTLILDPETGNIEELGKEEMAFDHRASVLSKSKKIILQATFTLPVRKQTCNSQALAAVKDLLKRRRSKHPQNPCTFGSTFKNPKPGNHTAGWYLEKVGMQGMRIGGAMVAREHANWILNLDNAKSSDVKKLIAIAQRRVLEEFGLQLEREVIYLPEDVKDWR